MRWCKFLVIIGLFFIAPANVFAATLLDTISQTNDKSDFVVRSNIWYGWKFTAGASATISGVTVNLDQGQSNYGSGTHTGLVIKFYSDNSGVMGTQIGSTLTYTSTNSGNGHTVYATTSGAAITLPAAGNYWIGFEPPSAANIYIEMSGQSGYTGSNGWASFLGANGIVDYYGADSYFSSATYGFPMMTIAGTEADSTAPTITSVASDKAAGSYTVGEVVDIDVTFSETVTSTGNVTVTLETGATDRTCTFTVTSSTTGTCNYTVQAGDTSADLTVLSISGTIADAAANAMSNFVPATNLAANEAIVIDTTNPTVSNLSPSDGATGISATANLVITFDTAVDVETGNITIKKSSDDSTIETIDVTGGLVTGTGTAIITVNPSVTLESLTGYYIQIDATAFDDAAGNSYAGIADTTTWNFTIADVGNPAVSSFSPIDGVSDVGIDDNLVIVFDEVVDVESGNLVIYKTADDSVITTIPITDASITGTGTTTITINPTADFEYATGYYVQIDATAFDDTSSNSYAGIADTTTWNFITESAPVTETRNPTTSTSAAAIARFMAQKNNTTPAVPQSAVAPTITRMLKTLARGDDVQTLQKFLNEKGFVLTAQGPGSPGNETDMFGGLTRNAVMRFQSAHGLYADGIVGPITHGKMLELDLYTMSGN